MTVFGKPLGKTTGVGPTKKRRAAAEVLSTLRRSDAWAALLMLALAAAPFFPPSAPWQWKLQSVLTEMGVWFSGVCLAGGIVAGVRRRRGLSSLFLAVAFLLAAFLFFRPWWQFLAARPTWSGVMDKVFGAVEPPPLSSRSSLEREIVFKEMSPAPLRIRLFLPVEEGPWPWVVAVHPGGWDSGSTDDFRWMHRRLARRGWAVAVPEYRLAPDHPWPAQREDIEDAVRFLKQNAERLHLDSSRWALLGRSAGGQIAESVAFASQDPSLKGLIACYAPSDLLYAYEHGREDDVIRTRPLLRRLIGGSPEEMRGAYIKASPINAVSSHAPPTLLLHGPRDTVTWSLHSRRLAERLAEVRVPVVLIEPPWAAHGFDYFPAGPGGRLAAWAMERFLSAVFAKGTSR